MNKFVLVFLSILGGCEVVFYIFTPMILSVLWISIVELSSWTFYFLFMLGFMATIFRAIKIGFLKNKK